jgi:hypothetical protein
MGKATSKARGRRWSKDVKKKRPPVSLESAAVGGFEAVSIRLNKGAGSVDDVWSNVPVEVSEPVAVPRLPQRRNYSRKLTFTGRSPRKSGINAGQAILHLDAHATTDLGELPDMALEDTEADWDNIQTFLSTVAATTTEALPPPTTTSSPVTTPAGSPRTLRQQMSII